MPAVERAAKRGAQRLRRFGAHAADDIGGEMLDLPSRRHTRDAIAQLFTQIVNRLDLGDTVGTPGEMLRHPQHLSAAKLAVGVGAQLSANVLAIAANHVDLKAARRFSRARAGRDFTVPTATPSVPAISS